MSTDAAAPFGPFDSGANLIKVDASSKSVYAESRKRLPWQHSPKELGQVVPIIHNRDEMMFVGREDCFDYTARYAF
jgi:hypothetical protein